MLARVPRLPADLSEEVRRNTVSILRNCMQCYNTDSSYSAFVFYLLMHRVFGLAVELMEVLYFS
jgi:hypothetical protein